jgi:O-methyltransferase/8-demethyl-8-(2,3-dimethoxy-alpha-L-rhamnosyl)tetracenomycin-C 4'-O-methyltransferase
MVRSVYQNGTASAPPKPLVQNPGSTSVFLEGWFKDTLPTAPIDNIAVLRLDGDMYESTIQALEALYPKVSDGGFVIIDDYFLKPCAQAVDCFRRERGIHSPLIPIDGWAVWWRVDQTRGRA